MKAWSREYEKCIICGTQDFIYYGKGLCKKCADKLPENRKKKSEATHRRLVAFRKRYGYKHGVNRGREYSEKELQEMKDKKYAAVVRWRQNHKDRRKAHIAVFVAVRNGTLKKKPCEQCGDTKRIHAHHDDYSKPLKVRWLCPVHHGELSRTY